jgi:hypothetical protein
LTDLGPHDAPASIPADAAAALTGPGIRPRQQKRDHKKNRRETAQQRHRERTMSAKDILRKDGSGNYLRCLAAIRFPKFG